MARLSQQDVNDALMRLLRNGDTEALACLMEGVKRGEISLAVGVGVARVTAVPAGPVQDFAQRLRDLRQHAGDPTLSSIAEHVCMSNGSMTRIFQGQTRSSWSAIKDIILFLGGDPADYREDYVKVKAGPGPLH